MYKIEYPGEANPFATPPGTPHASASNPFATPVASAASSLAPSAAAPPQEPRPGALQELLALPRRLTDKFEQLQLEPVFSVVQNVLQQSRNPFVDTSKALKSKLLNLYDQLGPDKFFVAYAQLRKLYGKDGAAVPEKHRDVLRFFLGMNLERFRAYREKKALFAALQPALQNGELLPASKAKGARVFDAEDKRIKQNSDLLPLDPQHGPIRLSPTAAHGGFSKIRLGVDEDGNTAVWRVLHLTPKANGRTMRVDITPLSAWKSEMAAMRAINSPLLPKLSFIDRELRVYQQMPIFASDLHNLIVPLHMSYKPLGDVLVKLARESIGTLVQLHKAGFVHRDLKPDNIFYSPKQPVVIGDFGLTIHVRDVNENTGSAGTPGFRAPETMRDYGGRIHPANDIFSWGMTFLFIATAGASAQTGLASRNGLEIAAYLDELHWFVKAGKPKDLSGNPGSPDALYTLVAKHHPDFADLLFHGVFHPDDRKRLSAKQIANVLQLWQPAGSAPDMAAGRQLEQALAQEQQKSGKLPLAERAAQLLPEKPKKRRRTKALAQK